MFEHGYAAQVMALTMMGEARNQSILGRLAVGWTVQNRAIQKGRAIDSGCFQRAQYSCWLRDPHTTNDEWLLGFAERVFKGGHWDKPGDFVLFRECQYLAGGILSGVLRDPTRGSCHYLTTALLSSKPPSWVAGRTPAVVIDSHAFFAGIAW